MRRIANAGHPRNTATTITGQGIDLARGVVHIGERRTLISGGAGDWAMLGGARWHAAIGYQQVCGRRRRHASYIEAALQMSPAGSLLCWPILSAAGLAQFHRGSGLYLLSHRQLGRAADPASKRSGDEPSATGSRCVRRQASGEPARYLAGHGARHGRCSGPGGRNRRRRKL